jgi:hypothetical protein
MEGGETMEIIGMSLEELEAHSRAQLLPNRVQMARRKLTRIRKGNIRCSQVAFGLAAGEDAEAEAENDLQTCIRLGTVG